MRSNESDTERRRHRREATRRAAEFRASYGTGRGIVEDISCGGLCLATTVRVGVGERVMLDIAPRQDKPRSRRMRVEGTVTRVLPRPNGFTVGIAFLPTRFTAVRHRIHRTPRLPSPEPGAMVTLHRVSDMTLLRRRSHYGRAALLLLLLLLLGGGLLLSNTVDGPASVHRLANPEAEAASVVDEPDDSLRQDLSSGLFATTAPAPVVLDTAMDLFVDGAYRQAGDYFAALTEDPFISPTVRFIAQMGFAQSEGLQRRNAVGLVALQHELDRAGHRVPDVWREAADELKQALMLKAPAGLERLVPRPAFDLAPRTLAPAEPPVLVVEVDQSDFTLTVLQNNVPIRRFPVGIGAQGATPQGEFRIANKLIDPDWYNEGVVVKSGDPRNPLGRHWLGLGQGGKTTGYGIHPSGDANSIGAQKSRGCIRMRPRDAEQLFGLCEVGTPVRIAP